MKYPVRCVIVDVDDKEVSPGIIGVTPDISKPHIGKQGLAEKEGARVKITLDDGGILYGDQCWWEPIYTEEEKAEILRQRKQRIAKETFLLYRDYLSGKTHTEILEDLKENGVDVDEVITIEVEGQTHNVVLRQMIEHLKAPSLIAT